MRRDLPAGTVTFLFTDVEGSTRLLHELGQDAYAAELARHRAIVRDACAAQRGAEVDTQGDAFFFAFPDAEGALAAASALTAALAEGPVHVRLGLHTGTPLVTAEGYVGDDVHFAARVASSGHGGQILVSAATAQLVSTPLTSLGSHRLKDIAEPVTIFQVGTTAFPPLKTIANSNLPTPASTFLGREPELYEADLLLRERRLLTVHGPGGQGKTRFALELARRARDERFADYPDGVFACFLASLRGAELVLPTIGKVLSVDERGAEPPLETLSSHLEGKRILLLLDNLEHVLECATELSQLLRACPGLTIVATSRELLRLDGELAYELPPLPEDEAVALFCERAQVEPSDPIRELCARLEGLPLAIELAAARIRVLGPVQLLERLSQRLDLLKGGRDADPRQQTLRATIEWSYELLTPEEQQLFRRLSVFAGGCTLEAAEEVCDATLDTLQPLVEKSLLRFTDERYWMLETIREYAGERMREAEMVDELRRHHAMHYLELGRNASPHLHGSEAGGWFDRLERDLDNLRQALDYFAATDPEHGLELANAVFRVWWVRGLVAEGRRRLEEALDRTSRDPSAGRAHALHSLEYFASSQGDYDVGREYAEQALRMHQHLGQDVAAAYVLNTLGANALARGDSRAAKGYLERCLDAFEDTNEEFGLAMTLGNLGEVAIDHGELADAVAMLDRAVAIERRIGWDEGLLLSMCALGTAALLEGRIEEAVQWFHESLQVAKRLGHVEGTADCIEGLAACASARGRHDRAVRLSVAAASVRETAGVAADSLLARRRQEIVERSRAALQDDVFASARSDGYAMSVDEAVEYALAPLD